MKIVSDFSDFYEWDCYRYGEPDRTLEWRRFNESGYFSTEERDLLKLKKLFLSGSAKSYIKNQNKSTHKMQLFEEVIGIYPYVYYMPQLYIEDCGNYRTTYFEVADSIRCIKEKDFYIEFLKSKGFNPKKVAVLNQVAKAGEDMNMFSSDYRSIKDPFIIEDTSIFNHIKSPIFQITKDTADDRYYIDYFSYKKDICISETGILNVYPEIMTDRDVYTDIENFLWSLKKEPISIPDNKTKIVSHGFDLKTSFRKM